MNARYPRSRIEHVAGSAVTELLLTAVGAAGGGVLAPLLPVLAKSLAASRQQQRIDGALRDILILLDVHQRAIQELTDPQYKLLNEAVLALLHTTENEKLIYLKRTVKKTLYAKDLRAHEAIVLSRMVRDISADEAAFLLRAFASEEVNVVEHLKEPDPDYKPKDVWVTRESPDGLCASGLFSLGVLMYKYNLHGGGSAFCFSPITGKLIVLLAPDDV